MKHYISRNLLALVLMLSALPVMSQDCMEIFFSDGTTRRFFLRNVTEMYYSNYDFQHNNFSGTPDFQIIVTQNNEYVYDVATIDSITFAKFDEEKVSGNFASAATAVHSALKNCEDVKDVENYLETIKQAEGVEKAWVVDNVLKVKIKDWETITFFIDPVESPDNSRESLARREEMQKLLSKVPVKTGDGPVKAIVANQETNDGTRRKYIYDNYMPLVEDIAKCGIHYTYEASPTVDFFSSQMYLYDLVFLVTHGSAEKVNDVYVHELITADCLGVFDEGEVLHLNDWDQMFEKLDSIRRAHRNSSSDHITYGAVREERDGVYKIVYYATVTETFLKEKAVGHFNNPNSIFFNAACSSLKGNTNLAYEFLNRGLGVYIGYDNTNCKGKKAGPQFFRSMLGGQSFVKALTSLPYNYLVDGCGGNLQRVTDNRDAEFEKVFIFPTFTTELSDEQATESFNANQYLEFEGMTTASNFNDVTYGFVFDIDDDVRNGQFFESTEKTLYPSTTDRGNLKFNVEIRGFKRGQTYYYSAYTYDGELYNYGNTCSFTIGDEPQVPEDPEDEDRLLMLMANVNGALYSIYKQKMDKNDYHENPDGWKFYRSLLTLDVSRNGSTTTYTLDDNIYMEEGYNSNSAQNACMLFDLKSNQIYVFCVSKDQKSNYTMEGFCYGASLSDLNFQRETAFTSANWGWYPYFVESPSGRPAVAHFSYAGYYEIISTRDGSNNWSSEWGNKIQPDDFQTRSKQSGRVLVISGGTDPGNEPTSYTACPDGNHPHLIDLGLPSGTKWACCNLGASKPEDYGSYYAWGETVEKRVYTWNNYQYGYYNDDYDYSHMTNIGSDIAGTKYDVASVKTDGLWVMPNKAQFEELLNNTTHQYVANKGVKLVARNGGSIFLPSAGDHFDGSLGDSGYLGLYWSSTLFDEAPFAAYHYAFDCVSQIEHFTWLDRFDGVSVRPVWK